MEKFGLIGYPLGHSMSAVIHKAGFESLGIDADYKIFETPPEQLIDRIKFFKRENYSGFNITIPHKVPMALFVDSIDKYADITGSINTIKIKNHMIVFLGTETVFESKTQSKSKLSVM